MKNIGILILLWTLLIVSSAYSQNGSQIKTNTIYNLDSNPYTKDPFKPKEIQIVKVLKIKNGYVQYQIIKAWCCEGKKFSTTLEVFSDQVKSYKRKYN